MYIKKIYKLWNNFRFMNSFYDFELNDGNYIPAVGLGTRRTKGEKCIEIVRKALNIGYRHIDTAEIYGNEADIGKTFKDFDRAKIFLVSKVWRSNLHFNDVIEACNNSLEKLSTNYLDLYLIHRPDAKVPLKETFEAFKVLIDKGKLKSVGVSNFTIDLLKMATKTIDIPITVNQVEFHPYLSRKKLLEFCKSHKIVITAYAPLGMGVLIQDKTLGLLGDKYNKSPAQICLRWNVQKGVAVIPRSYSEIHLKENLDIFNWEISKEDMETIDSLNRNMEFVVDTSRQKVK
jgi:diketogulonate reductase-like aldo/keto reductase